ncbi:ABC transporter ATP-binding protein [Acidocella sp.]|uniref:ABC transporter ATP-binding protein n=1 Tax=Acidocella sp. TaxID=50710 RepID=UPI003D01A5F5
MTKTLQVNHLRKAFGGVMAVDDISFEVAEGEMLALIGPNGAGKSTCFNMVGGQFPPSGGNILLKGEQGEAVSIAGIGARRIWRLGVGRTFQITATFTSMTVRQNVQMALLARRNMIWKFWARANDLLKDEAQTLLETVGLRDQAERAAGILAYGDLKRLELAIALAGQPKLLLMDEPTAGMASGERTALMALVRGLVSRTGISVLFTEHDMDVVFDVSDRILVLDRGRLIAAGTGGGDQGE